MIKEYVIEFWNDEYWADVATLDNKESAEEEINYLLKTHNPVDLRIVGYFA